MYTIYTEFALLAPLIRFARLEITAILPIVYPFLGILRSIHGLSGLINLLPVNLNLVPNTGHLSGIIETTYAAVMSHGRFFFFALRFAQETVEIAQAICGLFLL